jgi:cytochrome c-type biogenesis protein CcmE
MSLNAKLVVITLVTTFLAYLGASSSWRYYVLVDECVARGEELRGERLRVTGRVAAGSLCIREDRKQATFQLVGATRHIEVACPGPLPDNLKEEMEVVVEGRISPTSLAPNETLLLEGDKVLTRCASKYEARESN